MAGPLDLQAPICSLGALRLAGGVGPLPGYLTPDAADVAAWAERLNAMAPASKGVRRVGLALGTRQVQLERRRHDPGDPQDPRG